MGFYEKLKDYFNDNHLNQSAVARDMNIDVKKLNATINGRRRMEVEEFESFCQAVKADPKAFLNVCLKDSI